MRSLTWWLLTAYRGHQHLYIGSSIWTKQKGKSQFLPEKKNVFPVKEQTIFRTWKLQAEERQTYNQDIHFKHGSINKLPFIKVFWLLQFWLTSHFYFMLWTMNLQDFGPMFHSINIRNLWERFLKEFKILFLREKMEVGGEGGILYLHFQLWSLASN